MSRNPRIDNRRSLHIISIQVYSKFKKRISTHIFVRSHEKVTVVFVYISV